MVGEIILCVKEANKKTRVAAYQLLVEIGHALHEVQPPVLADGGNDDDEGMGGKRCLALLAGAGCT